MDNLVASVARFPKSFVFVSTGTWSCRPKAGALGRRTVLAQEYLSCQIEQGAWHSTLQLAEVTPNYLKSVPVPSTTHPCLATHDNQISRLRIFFDPTILQPDISPLTSCSAPIETQTKQTKKKPNEYTNAATPCSFGSIWPSIPVLSGKLRKGQGRNVDSHDAWSSLDTDDCAASPRVISLRPMQASEGIHNTTTKCCLT